MIGIYASIFFGGAFFVNGIPHFVHGISGQKFTSPFAKPPGKGDSSAVVNVLWGSINFVIAYLLLCAVVTIDLHDAVQKIVAASGGLAMALILAFNFSRTRGGKA